MKILNVLMYLGIGTNFFLSQQTIEKKNIYFPMDERLIQKRALPDPVQDSLLLESFEKIPFYKAVYTEKDFPYASKEHYYFPADHISPFSSGLIDQQIAYIPDIYSNTDKVVYNRTSDLLELTMPNKHNLTVGDYIMLETKDGLKLESKVEKIPNEFTFSVKNNLPKSYSYFIRGKKVSDLKHLDRDELLVLHMKVTQLLELKMKDWDKRTELLEKKIGSLEKELKRVTGILNKIR